MKKMHELKKWFTRLTESKPATMAISIVVAVLIWFIISVNVYPTTPVTLYNIPVVIETAGTPAAESGLSVVSYDVETVNVQLVGNRSQVGALTEEDLTAYAVIQESPGTGQTSLAIDVRSDKNVSFEVKSISPSRVNVTFDKIETRTYDVTPSFPNVVITAGHTMNEVTCEPATIDITGPTAQLNEIDHVVVTSQKDVEIDSSYVLYSSDVTLYNADNSILDAEQLEIPTVNFKIDIPILTQKELALTYKILNAPSTFDVEWLMDRLELSADAITVASPNSTLAEREDLTLGFVRLEEITLNYKNTFDVPIEESMINQSGLQQVTLSLNSEGLERRSFTVSSDNIIVVNTPGGYDFDIITKNLNISVIGPTEQLDELSATDIVVTVDLTNYNPEQSESFSENSQISFTNASNVWAEGSYKIALNRVERTEPATDSGSVDEE